MFRKYLFLGLTAMLGAVFVYLVVQSRRAERRVISPGPVEIVRTSRPSATRAIAPADLSAGMCRVSGSGIEVQIRNGGRSSYHNIMLQLSFLAKNNSPLGTRKQLVRDTVPGGGMISASGIQLQDLPAGAARCTAQVLYADIE